MTKLRLLPMVLLASGLLLALKSAEWLINGQTTMSGIGTAVAQTSTEGKKDETADTGKTDAGKTGAETKSAKKSDGKKAIKPVMKAGRAHNVRPNENNSLQRNLAKTAVLERLGERRVLLDKREKELDLRDALLRATEKRLEARIKELKAMETKITSAMKKKKENEEKQFDDLVKMYESMKPKEAARIFDRLQMGVLVKVVKKVNPRRMADILGKMTPETAEKLTVALATKRDIEEPKTAKLLPKIGSETR